MSHNDVDFLLSELEHALVVALLLAYGRHDASAALAGRVSRLGRAKVRGLRALRHCNTSRRTISFAYD